jgi:tRNA dimethylallyltransferase
MDNPIIVLTGPTASGKTAMSFALAKKNNAEIICADSMTVYRGMDIGTDKPTPRINKSKDIIHNEDKARSTRNSKLEIRDPVDAIIINGVRHHLLDILNPDQEFNASIFKNDVAKVVADIQSRGKIPMLVGGSLLYIDSYVYDYDMPQVAPDPKLREELEQKTNDDLFAELVSLDPDAEWTIDRNNRRRVVRALEVCLKSGAPFTSQKAKKKLPKCTLYLAVAGEREVLYGKINKRVDEMMAEGFLEEVQSLYKKYDHSTALQATGYRQLVQYIDGEVSLDDAIEQTKKSHRNFAKRQLTWLRRNKDVIWIKTEAEADTQISKFLKP